MRREWFWRVLISSLIAVNIGLLFAEEALASPISEETRWWVTLFLGITGALIGIGAVISGIVVGRGIAKALSSAFRHTESTIESGFSQTEQNSAILTLGSKGDRPNWSNFLRKAKEETIDRGFVKMTTSGFVTTEAGEGKLAADIQKEVQDLVQRNPEVTFEELAATIVEEFGIRRLSLLSKGMNLPLNEMIAIVAGFAQRIRTKE